jgi:hypothetical protein
MSQIWEKSDDDDTSIMKKEVQRENQMMKIPLVVRKRPVVRLMERRTALQLWAVRRTTLR